jgi:3-oxoacyl-[acyl-carrier protein] reductase
VDAITKSLAKELGPRNIRVKAITPGMVETEGTHSAGIIERFSEAGRSANAARPYWPAKRHRRSGSFFASSDADWINGEVLVIAGGFR